MILTDGCNPPTTEVTYIEGDTTARGTSSTPPTPGGSRYLCKFAISCSILLQTSPLAKPHFLHLGPWCRPLFLSFRPMSLSSLSVAHQCPSTCPLRARSRPHFAVRTLLRSHPCPIVELCSLFCVSLFSPLFCWLDHSVSHAPGSQPFSRRSHMSSTMPFFSTLYFLCAVLLFLSVSVFHFWLVCLESWFD